MQFINNQFQIQGLNVSELCKEFGTPLYIYDGEKIVSQYHKLANAFTGVNVKIKYAAKALTNQAILKLLNKVGCGIDVVSLQELQLALIAGFTKENIMYTPNCVPFEEIEEAVKTGVIINIDNLPFLERFGKKYGHSHPCSIRLNPHIEEGGNAKIMTAHKGSKFGISVEQVERIYAISKEYNLNVLGLHVHMGSDFKSADSFIKAYEIVFDIARNFKELKFLDFGGGFKVAYKEGDSVTDVNDLGVKMTAAFSAFCKEYGKNLELWFEPGKFLVSESGYLMVKATVIKETPATTFIGVDSGLNHLIRPMMYGAYHDVVNVSNNNGAKKKYTVVGYICETDTFGTDLQIAETKEGDLLAIKNAGAYGFSMSSNYNSRFRPAEVLVYNGKAQLIRKREVFEDLLKNQVDVAL